MTENYFCVRLKNRREHNQHFKLLFVKLNSTGRKLNFLHMNSVYLVVSSLEMQRRLM